MSHTIPCKKHNPGSAPYGYTWETTDDVVEVAAEHLADLVRASHGDIYEVINDQLEASDEDPLALQNEEEDEVKFAESDLGDLATALSVSSATIPQPRPRKAPARKAAAKPKTTE